MINFKKKKMNEGIKCRLEHKTLQKPYQTYLPGSEDTVISKAVPPGRDFLIALRGSWSLRFPQMWGTREHNLWELGTAFALSPISKLVAFCLYVNVPCWGCVCGRGGWETFGSTHLNIVVISWSLTYDYKKYSACQHSNLKQKKLTMMLLFFTKRGILFPISREKANAQKQKKIDNWQN